VVGALVSAVSGIADVLPTRAVFVASALVAAAVNGLLIGTGGDLRLALPLRFLLGVFLAGVYPTGMKLMTGWFLQDRGLAIGILPCGWPTWVISGICGNYTQCGRGSRPFFWRAFRHRTPRAAKRPAGGRASGPPR